MNSPELFGVVLEEHLVERLTKAVYVEILKRGLRELVDNAAEISEARLHRVDESHVDKSRRFQRDGVVEEALAEVYPGQAGTRKENVVDFIRVYLRVVGEGVGPAEHLVVL